MEAKDTVMSPEEISANSYELTPTRFAQAQAEISFRAGMREVVDSLIKDFDYCDSAGDNFTGIGYFISTDEWQAKLKEWGIE